MEKAAMIQTYGCNPLQGIQLALTGGRVVRAAQLAQITTPWEKETTDVVNELQHQVKNLVIEPEEKVALIYADTDNIATNIQNYTPIFAEGENTGLFVAFTFKNFTKI